MAYLESSCIRIGHEPICCQTCGCKAVKNGFSGKTQRYKCPKCKKRFLQNYRYRAYQNHINHNIIALIKEGCGIRSISRLLRISTTTVLSRIRKIANKIKQPAIAYHQTFEIDELRTYIKKKLNPVWVVVAVERTSRQVVSFHVGRRTNRTLSVVIQSLMYAQANQIFTDKLRNYQYIIQPSIHQTQRFGTNHVERQNLNLRTHLKRLNRRTICYSKSTTILSAIVRIYLWG
jgi:IS1 family transposase/transposase-like protein